MIVDNYTDADFDRIKSLHTVSKLKYPLTSVPSEEFFSRRVIRSDESIRVAAFLRLTAEAILICDPTWRNPAWRFDAIKQISNVCRQDAAEIGIREVVAFIPPRIESGFKKRLVEMGWSSTRRWPVYYTRVA